jgi:hypothetical protein
MGSDAAGMAAPWRLFWLFVLVAHGALGLLGFWALPGGFPAGHPRLWANRIAPVVVLVVVVLCSIAMRRGQTARLQAILVAFPAAWAGAVVAGRLVFPISSVRVWPPALLGAVAMGVAARLPFRLLPSATRRSLLSVALIAAILGAAVPLTQRGAEPDTRPLQPPVLGRIEAGSGARAETSVHLAPNLMVHGHDGSLTFRAGHLSLFVEPILTFLSRSPDRCWTILAAPSDREGPRRHLTAMRRDGDRVDLAYRCDGLDTLRVEPASDPGSFRIEATTQLPGPVYSHLNSYCDVEIIGHRRLSLAFSPCPDLRVAVLPSDYPVGRPSRFAYLDARGIFHVAEATSGEKGPFHDLAKGPLARSDPLTVILYDQDEPVGRITWDDWAAQLGTAPSPTAGWGIPVNAIEFSLSGDADGSPASLFLTLAGTSVGRGWDSVGHSPGNYRNRMRIEPAVPKAGGH